MLRIFSHSYRKVLQVQKQFEQHVHVKIGNKGKILEIEGKPEDEYIAEKIIHALDFGFPVKVAMLLAEEDYLFDIVKIKALARSHNRERIRARIIGTHGKTLKNLSTVSNCFFELKDNEVGIIGNAEHISYGRQAIESLIKGAKQANVYSYLEKHHPKKVIDLGLKEPKKKKKATNEKI